MWDDDLIYYIMNWQKHGQTAYEILYLYSMILNSIYYSTLNPYMLYATCCSSRGKNRREGAKEAKAIKQAIYLSKKHTDTITYIESSLLPLTLNHTTTREDDNNNNKQTNTQIHQQIIHPPLNKLQWSGEKGDLISEERILRMQGWRDRQIDDDNKQANKHKLGEVKWGEERWSEYIEKERRLWIG